MGNRGGLEGVKVGAAGLLSGIIDGIAQRAGREGGAGDGIHTASVGGDHVSDHGGESDITHMGGFSAADDLHIGQCILGEGDSKGGGAVVAFRGGLIGAGSESNGCVIHAAFKSSLDHFKHSTAGEGCAGGGVDAVNIALIEDGSNELVHRVLTGNTGERVGFLGVVDIQCNHFAAVKGDGDLHVTAETFGGSGVRALLSGCEGCCTDQHHAGEQKGQKSFHRNYLLFE